MKEKSDDNHNYLWWVPITYTTQENPDFNKTKPSHWLKKERSITLNNMPAQDKWVIFNINETGTRKYMQI